MAVAALQGANSLRAELHDKGIEVATIFRTIQTNISINALMVMAALSTMMKQPVTVSRQLSLQSKGEGTSKGEEYIVVAGSKEKLATRVNRVHRPNFISSYASRVK